jgi:alkanesulfonate monooxygenase SsuD/methylene tetrahydromethanopterin reductase-like flavin-dependent oxidoreductase (luciferase family)
MTVSVGSGTIVAMRYGLDISPAGAWGRPDEIAELSTLAEDHGWDGVFCEDYLAFPGGLPTYDVWVTLGLVAQATTRLTIGTMVTPLPARHPETLTLQVASVAAVSGGRLVLGVGSGDPEGDPVIGAGSRGERLDAGLEVVRRACPGVPVWWVAR